MQTNRSFLQIAGRTAAFSLLMAGTVSLLHAQQVSPIPSGARTPFLLTANTLPFNLATTPDTAYSSSSSSDSDELANDPSSLSSSLDATQPPPRRRYGRPNYADSHTNPDGSSKYTFMVGAGFVTPVQDTGNYLTTSWVFQVGGGRNFNKKIGVLLQFDYNDFGFQGKTLANQQALYNSFCTPQDQALGLCAPFTVLGGNSHVWSFTLDPTYTFYDGEKMGAYVVGGVGFYHKTADFTTPVVQTACDPFYGCIQYQANQTVDDYTSNAVGFDGGLGLTYKPSRFSGQRLYVEARYVFMDNSRASGLRHQLVPAKLKPDLLYPGNFRPALLSRSSTV